MLRRSRMDALSLKLGILRRKLSGAIGHIVALHAIVLGEIVEQEGQSIPLLRRGGQINVHPHIPIAQLPSLVTHGNPLCDISWVPQKPCGSLQLLPQSQLCNDNLAVFALRSPFPHS